MKEGDVLVAVDSTQVKSFNNLFDAVQASKGQQVQLTVLRNAQELKLPVAPGLDSDGKYRLGLTTSRPEKLSFGAALSVATTECRENSSLIFKLLGKLVRGKAPLEQVSGPVGMMKETGQAAQRGFVYLLFLMAMISLNLALVNLLPIPILDGGLMLMLLIEGVIRRDIKLEIKERVYQAAFVFLVVFFLVITYFDLAK